MQDRFSAEGAGRDGQGQAGTPDEILHSKVPCITLSRASERSKLGRLCLMLGLALSSEGAGRVCRPG